MVDDPVIPSIVERLRAYVAERPAAVDTLRGIRGWWLAGLDPPPGLADIAAALRQLEAEGLFESVILPDGTELWRPAGPRP